MVGLCIAGRFEQRPQRLALTHRLADERDRRRASRESAEHERTVEPVQRGADRDEPKRAPRLVDILGARLDHPNIRRRGLPSLGEHLRLDVDRHDLFDICGKWNRDVPGSATEVEQTTRAVEPRPLGEKREQARRVAGAKAGIELGCPAEDHRRTMIAIAAGRRSTPEAAQP